VPAAGAEAVDVRLSGVTSFDSSGVDFLLSLLDRSTGTLRFRDAPEALKEYALRLTSVPGVGRVAEGPRPDDGTLIDVLAKGWRDVRASGALFFEFLYWTLIAPLRGRRLYVARTIRELNLVGVDALLIVAVIGGLMGLILAFNAAAQLQQFGANIYVADLVGVALTRELAPVITAVIVAGRTGSAFAAELSTMRVTDEMDALEVMGINHTQFLIVPKILALMLAMPALTIIADALGLAGGYVIGTGVLELSGQAYLDRTALAVTSHDVLLGLGKSVVFGLLIALTGCSLGMAMRGGAEEVGRVTNKAVVVSFYLVVISDAFFTIIDYYWSA
jgi:phospholipid/cholesterol/gamma-HCH transport system permease protein